MTSGRRAEGIGDLHISADLTQPGEPERLIGAALERFGRSTASSTMSAALRFTVSSELDDEAWERSWQLNVMSAVRALRVALPVMQSRRSGAIVNVSSTAAKRP